MPTFASQSTQPHGSSLPVHLSVLYCVFILILISMYYRTQSVNSALPASNSPTSFHNDTQGSKAYGSIQRIQTPSVPGQLAHWGSILKRCITEYKDHCEPDRVLGVENQSRQEKSDMIPTQVIYFVHYEYHLDSSLIKPTKGRWQKLQALILKIKSKYTLAARCLISLIGFLA